MPDHSKRGLVPAAAILPSIIMPPEVIRPEDIGYMHSIFVQCFMPLRHRPDNKDEWQTDCGRASLLISAGRLVNPNKPNTFVKMSVPAGPKARIVNAYITDYVLSHNTRTVPLGASMRKAMAELKIEIGGKNGKELEREIKNFAAAEIILGVWDEYGAHQRQGKLVEELSFWIERNPDQGVLWQPHMIVSEKYFKALTEDRRRMAPVYMPALVKLQSNPRAMDIHVYLVYRLRDPLKRPLPLSVDMLHTMFGKNCAHRRHFWEEFKKALALAREQYPQADVEVKNDCIVLKDSPPLIPRKKMFRLGR